jgi:bifunctional non-homologous end joining protein LigD
VCTDEASLLYMASLGCIEINPWSSTIKKPDNPDWCIIDLDPDKNKFEHVIETAQVTRQVLEAAGIKSYCKTSGSTGLHIYIPLGAKYSYEVSKEFGRLIATLVHSQLPKFTSIERATADRRGKIYIDFLQNRPQATLAAAYSLRPKPDATVSMPLHWEEVKKGLTMQHFTIHNAIDRIKEMGDIFKPVLGKGINIKKAIAVLENL